MKQLTNYRRAVQYCTKIYNLANEYFFSNELPEVTLTIQENLGTYGHISVSDTWFTTDGKGMKELNIAAQHLSRPIECVVSTILHEMSHLYNMEHGIKDVSGYYHNKKFKKTAEEIAGLVIDKDEKYGWTITAAGERVIDFCIAYELEDIQISKGIDISGFFTKGGNGTTDKNNGGARPTIKKGNSIKWICPCCNQIVRTTKDNVNIICGDCNERFIKA